MRSEEEKREYARQWRAGHPDYGRDWYYKKSGRETPPRASVQSSDEIHLTDMQKKFVQMFWDGVKKHHIALEAALAAGYCKNSRRGASVTASRLLRDRVVCEAICFGIAENTAAKCQMCLSQFSTRYGSRQRFCSRDCREQSRNEKARLHQEARCCVICRASFFGTRNQNCCSPECRSVRLAEKNIARSVSSGSLPEQKRKWVERARKDRAKHVAAWKALKELGIEI